MPSSKVAVDTNILVRLFTQDHRQQYLKAKKLFAEASQIFVSKTVLLETSWVLSFSYRFTNLTILKAFRLLLGLKQVEVEQAQQVNQVFQLVEKGLDFADAFHCVSAPTKSLWASFDRKLNKKLRDISDQKIYEFG